MQSVVLAPLDWIKVPGDHRLIDEGGVERLAESIRELGLLQAVAAKPDGTLIYGNHRCAAFRRLGRTSIPCRVMDVPDLDAELMEIDENLVNVRLTPVEETVLMARRKDLYEARHPETRPGGNATERERLPDGTLASQSPHYEDSGSRAPSFIADTAAKTGKSPKTIERNVRIGRTFTAAEIEKFRAAKTPILEIDKLASLQQRGYAEEVAAVLAKPVEELRAAAKPLMAVKEENRTSAGRRKKILSDLQRRQESLARQTPEQQRARFEAGQLLEVDRLVERMERLTFPSCFKRLIAAASARLARLEESDDVTVPANNGSHTDAGVGAALADGFALRK